MHQETSLFAYRDIQAELPRRQRQVRDELALHSNMTNNELARQLNMPINEITPRTNELRKGGIVVLAFKRPCRVTGKTCCAWKLANK